MFGLGLGVSSSYRLERTLAGVVLAGLIAAVAFTGTLGNSHRCKCPYRSESTSDPSITARIVLPVERPSRADACAAYRAGDFARAAEIVDAIRPSDADLQILAQQYGRLATAWEIGMDPATPAIDAYALLREAWKLDTVLGGVHGERIQARLIAVVPRAALDYAGTGDYDNAELALGTAELLGIDNSSTRTVARILAEHRR
ncbi:MAG: hypothetical protein ABI867_45510 [Kofleriaceae bacterium]